jgi:hypothetical protein
MQPREALTMRRRLLIVAFVAAVVPLLVAAEPHRTEASEPFPVFTGEEFTDLFDGLDLPGTDPVGVPPSITGDSDADSRIRSIAEGRGYRLRPEMVTGAEWIGGEEVHGSVADAWESLRIAAARDGIDLELVSGFRSVVDQRGIFRTELDSAGTARIGRPYTLSEIAAGEADVAIDSVLEFHSIPGYSKHHTGYAIDVTMQGFDLSDFGDTRGFDWISAHNYFNAKQHGFVPSYPPGARDQGPVPEPWEYVWVGARTITCRGEGGLQPALYADADADESAVSLEQAASEPSRFVPVDGQRIFDTRNGGSLYRYLCAGDEMDVQITGVGQVPGTGVSAVVLNVTMTQTSDPGFVTVWPAGTPRPNVSSINASGSGQTVPNLVTIPVGRDGQISFYTQSGTHLIADVFGYYEYAETAQAGRLRTVSPQRVADTRNPGPPEGFVEAGDERRIDVLTTAGLSADDVSAVVLNLTVTQATEAGFLTVSPHDREWGDTSNLNVDRGQTAANLVITPVAADGTVDVEVFQTGAHLIVDLFGYFTSEGHGGEPTSGLFVPLPPMRSFDTRSEWEPSGRIADDGTMTALVAPSAGVPVDAAAALFNLTVVESSAAGFVTAWPGASDLPDVSNVNVTEEHDTRANAAILAIDDTGRLNVYSYSETHVLADVFGYYTP